MKILFLLLISVVTAFGQVAKQTDKGVWYYEYSDPECASRGDCYICVFLPGFGERGDGTVNTLGKVRANGTPKLLSALSTDRYIRDYIVLVPQQKEPNSGYITDAKNPWIVNVLVYFDKTYKYNSYLMVTGLSMGGGGSWDASYNAYLPVGLVDAIVPVSGGGDYNGAKETARRKIAAWAIHGDKDTQVPLSTGSRGINGMLFTIYNGAVPAGINSSLPSIDLNPLYKLKWTVIPGGTHSGNVWDIAFSLKPQALLGNTTIYQWFKDIMSPLPPKPQIVTLSDTVTIEGGEAHRKPQTVRYTFGRYQWNNSNIFDKFKSKFKIS